MRLLFLVLFSFIFSVNGAYAQIVRPGWFVAERGEEVIEDENETATAIEGTEEEAVLNKDIPQTEAKEITSSMDKVRFIKGNKDLLWAKNFLRIEFEASKSKNIAVSPLSVYLSSVILANGVVDESLAEFSGMFSILHLGEVNRQIKEYVEDKQIFSFYTALWGKQFSSRYEKLMKSLSGVEMWGIKDTTEQINNWANVRTKGSVLEIGEVKDVLDKEIYLSQVVQANLQWENPFYEKNTQKTVFHGLNGQKSFVWMMNKVEKTDYYEDDEMQAIRLYASTGDYLVVLLPREGVSFSEFVKNINISKLKPRFTQVVAVDIFLPRMSFNYTLSRPLKIFENLGVKRIFAKENNDFAKMVNFDSPSVIKDVYLNTVISITDSKNVKENIDNGKPKNTIQFNADRPFIFVINNGEFIGTFVSGYK